MKTAIARLFSATLLLGTMAFAPARAAEEPAKPAVETPAQRADRMQWWRDARFGMFIHWGIYAVPADGEWYMTTHHVPIASYEKYAAKFNPVKFDADQWAQVAHDAGMKYLVITAKHHDGFCMFKTRTTKYNIIDATPWHRDPLALLSEACKRRGVRFCCYYSIMDWHTPWQTAAKPDEKRPDYNPTKFASAAQKETYRKYMKAQLAELIAQCHPGVIWFDGGWINNNGWNAEDGKDLVGFLHQLDPQLIVNDRANGSGDFGTPEQNIPASGLNRDWETCMTINDNWGFSAGDHGFKSTSQLLHNLMDIASKGGNYLLNVGPTDEGVIPEPEVERLKEMGAWLKTNGEALYGTTAGPFKKQLAWGRATKKPGKLFLTVFDWPKEGSIFAPVRGQVARACLLSRPGEALKVESDSKGIRVTLPTEKPDAIASVVALEIEGMKAASLLGPAADGSIHPRRDRRGDPGIALGGRGKRRGTGKVAFLADSAIGSGSAPTRQLLTAQRRRSQSKGFLR